MGIPPLLDFHLSSQIRWPHLIDPKFFLSAALQFHTSNYLAMLAKYDFNNYAKLAELLKDVLQDKHQWFQVLLDEGRLQAVVDEEDRS